MLFKFIVALIGMLLISGCGQSAEEKELASYENGYSDGYNAGYKKALKCVDREGDEIAEDAADYCKRRM